jgi:hypothetical protein
MIRTQIILRGDQRRALEKLAREQARSISEIVREMIDAQLRVENERRLQHAAQILRGQYLSDPELTAFSVLDDEAFHEEGRNLEH